MEEELLRFEAGNILKREFKIIYYNLEFKQFVEIYNIIASISKN